MLVEMKQRPIASHIEHLTSVIEGGKLESWCRPKFQAKSPFVIDPQSLESVFFLQLRG